MMTTTTTITIVEEVVAIVVAIAAVVAVVAPTVLTLLANRFPLSLLFPIRLHRCSTVERYKQQIRYLICILFDQEAKHPSQAARKSTLYRRLSVRATNLSNPSLTTQQLSRVFRSDTSLRCHWQESAGQHV